MFSLAFTGKAAPEDTLPDPRKFCRFLRRRRHSDARSRETSCSTGSQVLWRRPTPLKHACPLYGTKPFRTGPRFGLSREDSEVSRFSCMLFLCGAGNRGESTGFVPALIFLRKWLYIKHFPLA